MQWPDMLLIRLFRFMYKHKLPEVQPSKLHILTEKPHFQQIIIDTAFNL